MCKVIDRKTGEQLALVEMSSKVNKTEQELNVCINLGLLWVSCIFIYL